MEINVLNILVTGCYVHCLNSKHRWLPLIALIKSCCPITCILNPGEKIGFLEFFME